jgi:hypothetical protein
MILPWTIKSSIKTYYSQDKNNGFEVKVNYDLIESWNIIMFYNKEKQQLRVELICDELNIEVESCVIKKSNIHIIMSWDGLNWYCNMRWGLYTWMGCHN